MFSKGQWVHADSMDVFYDVLAVHDVHPQYVKVKYRCWNISQRGEPWLLSSNVFKAKVLKKDRDNWRRYVVK